MSNQEKRLFDDGEGYVVTHRPHQNIGKFFTDDVEFPEKSESEKADEEIVQKGWLAEMVTEGIVDKKVLKEEPEEKDAETE